MKIVFSRKGFDSSSGGGPSPIVNGRALSLPIPDTKRISKTTYGNLGLGGHASRASRSKWNGRHRCHNDPMFLADGRAVLGQCGAAQTHLERQGVGTGDVFVFFGLFRKVGFDPHHRIFGYCRVERIVDLAKCEAGERAALAAMEHPHALQMHAANDAVWCGHGRTNAPASHPLRLTDQGASPSLWRVPSWLRETGLSYHERRDRWLPNNRLQSVARGQEFVADVGEREDALRWLEAVVHEIES